MECSLCIYIFIYLTAQFFEIVESGVELRIWKKALVSIAHNWKELYVGTVPTFNKYNIVT